VQLKKADVLGLLLSFQMIMNWMLVAVNALIIVGTIAYAQQDPNEHTFSVERFSENFDEKAKPSHA
jgi:hypothetical protein